MHTHSAVTCVVLQEKESTKPKGFIDLQNTRIQRGVHAIAAGDKDYSHRERVIVITGPKREWRLRTESGEWLVP